MPEKDDADRVRDRSWTLVRCHWRLPAAVRTHRRVIITFFTSITSARERVQPPLAVARSISVVPLHRQQKRIVRQETLTRIDGRHLRERGLHENL